MPRSISESIPCSPELEHSDDGDSGVWFPDWMLKLQGKIIQNRLEIGPVIGRGSFGVVYVAIETGRRYAGGRTVAVKVLSTGALDKAHQRQIQNEIICHRRVSSHPNIVTIHDCLEDRASLYIIMDVHSEGDLFKCITEDELYVGNDSMIREVFSQLLDAVEFCHEKGVYHRDLKPENILCRNGGSHVMLTDFGLATRQEISQEFQCGSEYYMSPECLGHPALESYSTRHNDIWALGVILVNLITCRNPWKRADLHDRSFASFYQNPVGHLRSTLPLSTETIVMLSRIFKNAPKLRMSISDMRRAIFKIPRLLLTPLEAAYAPDAAYEAATGLFEVIADRRPHLLLEHYEDICVHYPFLLGNMCGKLRASLVSNRIIGEVDDLFSSKESAYDFTTELPEWAQPLTVEIHPEQLENIADYPQSPDMSRDNSAGTVASGGPITPATHPTQVVDDVPEAVLDEVDQLGHKVDELKVSGGAARLATPSSSIFSNSIGPRIARVFGSAGNVFFR